MMRFFKLFICTIIVMIVFVSCGVDNTNTINEEIIGSMSLDYATQFKVDYYKNGYSLISIEDGEKYLLIPQDKDIPSWATSDITILQQPLDNVYLSASSVMDLFGNLNALDKITFTSTKEPDWSLQYVKDAFKTNKISYIGKYNAPDYETLLSKGCKFSIASTMIYHNPEVKEMLESQGISVLVERSSYENHPLGRFEWIKLYGLLLNKQDEAEKLFNDKVKLLENLSLNQTDMKTVAFFYVTSNGYVNVRKPNDYVSKMIQLAGGEYSLTNEQLNINDNALSTMNMQFETFYNYTKDVDILIYNSTIDGNITDIQQLIDKNPLFKDFKAIKTGDVWCTEKNIFQQSSAIADIISDFNKIFNGQQNFQSEFIYKLNK